MVVRAMLRYVHRVVGRAFRHARHAFDVLVALGLAVLALLEIFWPGGFVASGPIEGSTRVLVPTALAMTLPLALRRRFPLVTVVAVCSAAALQEVLTTPPDGLSGVTAVLLAAYSVAAYSDRRRAVAGLVAAVALSLSSGLGDAVFAAVLIGAAWGAGRIVRRQNLVLEALRRDQRARERAAVVEERARLARELHDVVAHGVTTMVVQAQAGEALVEQEPTRARDAFTAISSSGRQALAELRLMLGLLRATDDDPALDPQPALKELRSLVEEMRSVGLAVELEVDGEPRALPAGLELSAYRIVQEALTNTLKHASAATACVTVRYGSHAVEVEVLDDGSATGDATAAGHGLTGMRERVRLYGGTLETGPRPDGGFSVRARLPFGAA
jgi:signal transduction histidine kinase